MQHDPSEEKPATSNIWLVDLESDRWRPVTTFPATAAIPRSGGLDWTPDGRMLAFVLGPPDAPANAPGGSYLDRYWLCLAGTHDSGFRKVAPLPNPAPLAWSPDGERIAVVEPTPEARTPSKEGDLSLAASLSLVDVRTGARRSNLAHTWAGTDPSWSPDGRRLLYVRLGTCVKEVPSPDAFRCRATLPPQPDRAKIGQQGEAMTGPQNRRTEGTTTSEAGRRVRC